MKYTYNIKAFSSFNEESAYFLGLLYADGNLTDKGKIQLNIKDKELLEKFKLFLQTEKPIYYVKSTESYMFAFKCQEITDNLIKLGLHPRKSLTLKFPNFIPDDCVHHFIRGYFDGDGCVSYLKRKESTSLRVHFVGTLEFLFEIQKILIKKYNIGVRKIAQITENRNTFQLEIKAIMDVLFFKEFIYHEATVFLTRKKVIFDYDTTIKNTNHTTTSKYRNICFNKKTNRWRATTYINGIRKEKSSFLTEADAYSYLLKIKNGIK